MAISWGVRRGRALPLTRNASNHTSIAQLRQCAEKFAIHHSVRGWLSCVRLKLPVDRTGTADWLLSCLVDSVVSSVWELVWTPTGGVLGSWKSYHHHNSERSDHFDSVDRHGNRPYRNLGDMVYHHLIFVENDRRVLIVFQPHERGRILMGSTIR